MTVLKSADHTEMHNVVLFEQAASGDDPIMNTAADFRMLIDAAWPAVGVAQSDQTSNYLQVVQKSGGDATLVTIKAGYAVLPHHFAGGGKYLARLYSDMDITMPAVPSATRQHRIIAYALDKADGGDSDYGWAIEVLEDTTGTTPPQPDYAISLALVTRTSGAAFIIQTAITDVRPFAFSSIPAGTITMWGSTSQPAGYLICDGRPVSTSTYSALFAAIGYTYGGSGTSFNIPNFVNMFPYGNTPQQHNSGMGSTNHTHSLDSGGQAQVSLDNTGSIGRATENKVASSVWHANWQTANFAGLTVASSQAEAFGAGLMGDTGNASTTVVPPFTGVAFLIKT